MYNEFDFPVSVEEFAAYLDGNLSLEEMDRINSVVSEDLSMQELMRVSQLVSDTMEGYSSMELKLPEDILSMDFSVPKIHEGIETLMEVNTNVSLDVEPSVAGLAVCAVMPDVAENGDMVINEDLSNTNIDNISDIGLNISSGELTIDGE